MLKTKVTIVIPAYNPPQGLIKLITDLKSFGISNVLVINDGSDPSHNKLFERLTKDHTIVLKHPINRGKGAALKTGMAYFMDKIHGSPGIVTADADGQHTAEDILLLVESLEKEPETVFMGVRNISLSKTPLRNFLGNRIACVLLRSTTGKGLSDTQSGLRALPASVIPQLLRLEGQKFEYETQMLVHIIRSGTNIKEIPICTIYSKSIKTYFKPFLDSWSILKSLFN